MLFCFRLLAFISILFSMSTGCNPSLLVGEYGQKVQVSCNSTGDHGMRWFFKQMNGEFEEIYWGGKTVEKFNKTFMFWVNGSSTTLDIPSLGEEQVGRYKCCNEDGENNCCFQDLIVLSGLGCLNCEQLNNQTVEMLFDGNLSNDSRVTNLTFDGRVFSATITAPNQEQIQFHFPRNSSRISRKTRISRNTSTASTVLVGLLQNFDCSRAIDHVATGSLLSSSSSGSVLITIIVLVTVMALVGVSVTTYFHKRKCSRQSQRWKYCIYCRILPDKYTNDIKQTALLKLKNKAAQDP